VRKLIQQQDTRAAGKGCVEVELLQHLAAVLQARARQDRQVADRGQGLGAAMRLDDADQHVVTAGRPPSCLGQHLKGLADAGGGAEEHLQPAATLAPGQRQQGIGVWAVGLLLHRRQQ